MVALEPTCDSAHIRRAPSIHPYFTITSRKAKKILVTFQVNKARWSPTFLRSNLPPIIRIGYANCADSAQRAREVACLPGIERALRVPEQSLQHPRCPLAAGRATNKFRAMACEMRMRQRTPPHTVCWLLYDIYGEQWARGEKHS